MLATALNTAVTGMSAQATNVSVIANNIANANTTAFKRGMAQFADLVYQSERMAGVPFQGTATTGQVPESGQVGLGVQTIAIETLYTNPNPAIQTTSPYDLNLLGRGWFQVTGPNGVTLYTRAGNFGLNSSGQLVTQTGFPLTPNITFPTNTIKVDINTSGAVYVTQAGNPTPQNIGQIQLAIFPNDAGMEALGNNIFQPTAAAGTAQTGNPLSPGFAGVQQGWLEASNVDPVQEITNLITAQRNYELNSKVITAADEMYQTITKNNL